MGHKLKQRSTIQLTVITYLSLKIAVTFHQMCVNCKPNKSDLDRNINLNLQFKKHFQNVNDTIIWNAPCSACSFQLREEDHYLSNEG